MEAISVFDMFKIGVGPSSSHTMGPWRAALKSAQKQWHIEQQDKLREVKIHLYGSLAKTGKGHGTDIAVMMGLTGEDPATVSVETIAPTIYKISQACRINLLGKKEINFDPRLHINFHYRESLPAHPNGIQVEWIDINGTSRIDTFYSIGGGFVVEEGEDISLHPKIDLPYPIASAKEWQQYCEKAKLSPWEIIWLNEQIFRTESEIIKGLQQIWEVMLHCIYRGCHIEGELPGGLGVSRRAPRLYKKLWIWGGLPPVTPETWLLQLGSLQPDFQTILKWVSCFALAVNEENACFGRVVTAPTNGAAGVIPAVIMYMNCFCEERDGQDVIRFLLVAGEVGSLFKKRATISAALGGCQAEIGVSSAMAAAGLTACLGGSIGQVLMAAEIAMEHHLGLTCDPIGGLVQIPCIERNTMGAIKAITASHIALESDPTLAKVTLDDVITTMWETAQDMHSKYKETSEGGLALRIPVNVIEC